MYWYNGAVAKCHGSDTFYSLPSMEPILFPLLHPWVGHFSGCYLLNRWTDFDQTCSTDLFLGMQKELCRFW